jgi:peptidoglycan/xylan/chitin deacetylase (PgdA/CDA1 family)
MYLRNKVQFPANYKLVSFTFDDSPVSESENCTRILDSYNAHGTFYEALGIDDTE